MYSVPVLGPCLAKTITRVPQKGSFPSNNKDWVPLLTLHAINVSSIYMYVYKTQFLQPYSDIQNIWKEGGPC